MSYALSHSAVRSSASRRSLQQRLMDLIALRRQRVALANLDDTQLADIGLTRQEADQEAVRPIWDAPSHWSK